jgi:hypothetical protein
MGQSALGQLACDRHGAAPASRSVDALGLTARGIEHQFLHASPGHEVRQLASGQSLGFHETQALGFAERAQRSP